MFGIEYVITVNIILLVLMIISLFDTSSWTNITDIPIVMFMGSLLVWVLWVLLYVLPSLLVDYVRGIIY